MRRLAWTARFACAASTLSASLAGCPGPERSRTTAPVAPSRKAKTEVAAQAAEVVACRDALGSAPASFYVAPNAPDSGDGSYDSPWSLAALLASPTGPEGAAVVGPGARVFLRGGAYEAGDGGFVSRLKGAPGRPIEVRSFPGEWAVLVDSRGFAPDARQTLSIDAPHVRFRDLEIVNENPARLLTDCSVRHIRPRGVRFGAQNVALVNAIIHDVGVGVAWGTNASGSEVYGSIFYNGGWDDACDPPRGRAQAIYMRNRGERDVVRHNVMVNGFQSAVALFGKRAPLDNVTLDGNVWSNTGCSSTLTSARVGVQLWSTPDTPPPRGLAIENNVAWNNSPHARAALQIGGAQPFEVDRLNGNYLVGVTHLGKTGRVLEAKGNVFFGKGGSMKNPAPRVPVLGFDVPVVEQCNWYRAFQRRFPNNEYRLASGRCGDAALRAPETNRVMTFPNRADEKRAHVAIFNWEDADVVEVDLSGTLAIGERYVVLNAENYFGTPVVAGSFDGEPVRIDMTAPELDPAQPIASADFGVGIAPEEKTGRAFAILVVLGDVEPTESRGRTIPVRAAGCAP